MKKSVAKNAIFNMINRGLTIIFPLITITYVSRILGAAGIGSVASAQNFSNYFTMLAAMGIPSYGVKAIAQSKINPQKCNKVFTELFTINLFSTIFCVIIYFFTLWLLQNSYTTNKLYTIFVILVIFNIFNLEWVYQGFEEYGYITLRSFIIKLLSVCLMFFLVRTEKDLVGYALLLCFGTFGNYLLNMVHLKSYVKFDFSHIDLQMHLKPILIFFASVVAIEIYSLVDITMLTAMTNAEVVGYYSNSTKIIKMAANTLTALSAVLMPRLSNYFYNKEYSKIKSVSQSFLNITIAISIPSCVGLFLIAPELVITLLGNTFEPAVDTIRILSILIILMPLSGGVFCQLLLTSGNEKKYLICVLSGAIINIILNANLIKYLEQNGAAIASIVAELFVCLLMYFFSTKIIKLSCKKRNFISILVSSGSMLVSILVIKCFITCLETYIKLLTEIIIAVFIYFLTLIITKNELAEIVKRKIDKNFSNILYRRS